MKIRRWGVATVSIVGELGEPTAGRFLTGRAAERHARWLTGKRRWGKPVFVAVKIVGD